MKRILVPISFSGASKNSLKQAAHLYPKAHLTLLNVFPVQQYNRTYDFGRKQYSVGMKEKLKEYYERHVGEIGDNVSFLAHAGTTSQTVDKISKRFHLMVMSRIAHPTKKQGYFSDKKLFIATKAHCPVLLMPIIEEPFEFSKCEHIWHIKRRETEPVLVAKSMSKLNIYPERMEVKTLEQRNFLSSFWKNILAYEDTHRKNLLKKIDKAHDEEPIDLIILVDNEPTIFTGFFRSDMIQIFCKYEIPLLIVPAK